MSRGKSDSQLNAEAAERQLKITLGAEWTPPTYGSESGYRARPAPPPIRRADDPDPLTLWRAAAFAEPPQKVHDNSHQAAIGVDLANQLVRYIDGSAGHFPVHDALLAFDRACRRRHGHWPDHRGRPVCSEMVRLIIFGGASLLYCAEHLEISYPRAERLLDAAIQFMRSRQERWLADTGMSAGHEPEWCPVCRAAESA